MVRPRGVTGQRALTVIARGGTRGNDEMTTPDGRRGLPPEVDHLGGDGQFDAAAAAEEPGAAGARLDHDGVVARRQAVPVGRDFARLADGVSTGGRRGIGHLYA